MFNVLFVFFAMSINVALVVHDKINLQNSADMAAYYVASKQAEILNVIAHQNYQIRQSWKLLVWRYRVLGTMGLYQPPSPKHPVWSGEKTEEVYAPARSTPDHPGPTVCISYKPTWKEVPQDESLCNQENLRIPALPEVKVIAGFLRINAGIAALSRQLRAQFDVQCERHGAINWWFAASIMQAFREDQRNKKRIITALAKDLSNGQNDGDFIDLDGNSVMEGARKTFVKNLTYANQQSFENGGGDFKLYNSLANVPFAQWLVEVDIVPTILYSDPDLTSGCNASPRYIKDLPQRSGSVQTLQAPWPQGFEAGKLFSWYQGAGTQFLKGSDYQFSMGFEKNPWYEAYVGVQATTNPREIFFPAGNGVKMTARSFAKPFGGRIGPWYKSRWSRGAPNSEGDRVDPLVAPRMDAGGMMNSQDDPTALPNYSRFPGDTFGITSKLALNSVVGLDSLNASGGNEISFDFYKNIKEEMVQGGLNDVLAWDNAAGTGPQIRDIEIAAIAPDLFDMTYYSIEPHYAANYAPQLNAHRDALKIPSDTPILNDIGQSMANRTYSVEDQMTLAKQKSLQRQEAFYYSRDRANLLTSWLPAPGAFTYDTEASLTYFGKCTVPDTGLKYTNPGSCVAGGGRTGYSVKIISRDALMSGQHKNGGDGEAPGAIMNPPSGGGW